MSIGDMITRITIFSAKTHGKGASAEAIAEAEQALQLMFPESYRVFLSTFGWGQFLREIVYGVGDDVPVPYGLVRNAMAEYERFQPYIPRHLVPVSPDGAGNHYCLDVSIFKSRECPIVFWDHEQSSNQIPEQVAASFDEWIVRVLDNLNQQGYYSPYE